MPFTIAHPAAAIPLHRVLGRWGVLSALVIGSMTPDIAYFLPFRLERAQTHSIGALFWFCLPVGLALYGLFHVALKGPLLGLMPQSVVDRMAGHTATFRSLPSVPWHAVVVSLLVGALTHIVWDSFTHETGQGVLLFPVLRREMVSIGAIHLQGYRLLQHASTLLGMALIAVWAWHGTSRLRVGSASLPVTLPPSRRYGVIAATIAASGAIALLAALRTAGMPYDIDALRLFLREAVVAGINTSAFCVLAYSVLWHLWRLKQHESRL